MSPDTVVDCLFEIWRDAVAERRTPQTVMLLGAPGIGKTSSARALAARMTEHLRREGAERPAVCQVRDLSSCLPEDLGGLPFREGAVTRYAPQSWMAEVCAPDAYGVLVLDDLPAASVAVQVASRQIALEHRVHDAVLSPRVMVIVTGNRREDQSSAATLPAHFRNSVLMLTVEPSFKAWSQWYADQGHDPLVTRFLALRVVHFSQLPKQADAHGAFATPRTWTMLGQLLPVAKRTRSLVDLAAGLVGQGIAVEFAAFVRVAEELVAPEAVLDDPERAIPDVRSVLGTPDRMVAMVCALADTTVARARGKRHTDAHERYLRALAWVTEHGGREYVAASISAFLRARGSLAKLQQALLSCGAEPRVQAMTTALAACFTEG